MALTEQQQQQLEALAAAYAAAQARVETRLLERLRKLIDRLFGLEWFNKTAEKAVRRQMAEVVRDAQEVIADLTGGYLDDVFDLMDIRVPRSAIDKAVVLPKQLRKVDPDTQWRRPGSAARFAKMKGIDDLEAQIVAQERAEEMARMDLQLAAQEAERQKYNLAADETLVGHRRVLRPEMSESGPCGLCIVAATRIYKVGELKPLHGGCCCGSMPVTIAADPALRMNKDDFEVWMERGEDAEKELQKVGVTRDRLNSWYAAAGGTDREGLQRIRVRTASHGEIGPVLVNNKYAFRDPEATRKRAEKKRDPDEMWAIQDRLVKKFEQMLAAGNKDVAGSLEFHRRERDRWAKKRSTAA